MNLAPLTLNRRFRLLAAFVLCVSCIVSQASQAQNAISEYAGGGTAGGAASSVDLPGPTAAVRDASGNTYIAAPYSTYVFKMTNGTVTTFAGTGIEGYGGDSGPASAAILAVPTGLAIDSKGDIYIADPGNSRVRMVNAVTGIITTVAGSGTKCDPAGRTCGDGGPATGPNAALNLPVGVALDGAGNLYIADEADDKVRVVNMQATTTTLLGVTLQPGYIGTVAGNGTPCANPTASCGDGGSPTAANLNNPQGVGLDSLGNLYIADTRDNRIREVIASGSTISSVVGKGLICQVPTGTCGDGGPASRANLQMPTSVFLDPSNNIYIADSWDQKIRFANMGSTPISVFGSPSIKAGDIGTVAGTGNAGSNGDGVATSVDLNFPSSVFLDSAGNLIIADSGNQSVRQVASGTSSLTTIAGGGLGGDGGQATSAVLANPYNVAEDSFGNVYIADTANNRIRMVTATTGVISTVAGTGIAGHTGDGGAATSATLNGPTGITIVGENMWIADTGNLAVREMSLSSGGNSGSGEINLFAGTYGVACSAAPPACGDGGPATSAAFSTPESVAVDPSGNVYIADYTAHVVRVVNTAGDIFNFAGTGAVASQICPSTPAPAVKTALNHPSSVAVDSSGNVYIDDSFANTVCQVKGGMITNWALNGDAKYLGDGGPALSASQFFPLEIAMDPTNNLFISGGDFNCVRRVDAVTATIGTVAGNVAQGCPGGFSGDGGPATSADLNNLGILVDGQSNLYIADAGNNRIRVVHLTPAVSTTPPANFGAWPIGTTSTPQSLTITSSGGDDLSLTGFSVAGNDPNDFTQTGTTCGSLPASLGVDEACTVTFTFTPKNYGLRSATFMVSDNAPGSPQPVTLSGYGPYFTVTASPNTLTIKPGSSGTSTLTITPFGGFNQTVTLTTENCADCTIVPSSVTLNGTNSATATLTITMSSTTAPGTYYPEALGEFGPSGQLQSLAKLKVTVP
ncbi:MAG: choice-of-anchor D domain-containing protein [Candidatus Sulfotelmatobacter sp.]